MKRIIATIAALAALSLTLAGPATAESLLGDQSLTRETASASANVGTSEPTHQPPVEPRTSRESWR